MEELLLKSLPNLGVGIASLVVLYLVFKICVSALNERDKAFREFVHARNHEMTSLIVESTTAIKESSVAIKRSSDFIQTATGTMQEIRNHLIRDHDRTPDRR